MNFSKVAPFFLVILFACCFIACEEEDLNQHLVTQQESVELTNKGEIDKSSMPTPLVVLDQIKAGECCSQSSGNITYLFGRRNVNITVDDLTHNFYCGNGDNLVYKFYRVFNSACTTPITKYSNLKEPVFCLPMGTYKLLICTQDANCELGSSCSIPIGVAQPSSPVYSFNLRRCLRPYDTPDRPRGEG